MDSQALRAARNAAGISQMALSKASGVSAAYIAMIETGQRKTPTYPIVVALATALGVPPEVLNREDRPNGSCD